MAWADWDNETRKMMKERYLLQESHARNEALRKEEEFLMIRLLPPAWTKDTTVIWSNDRQCTLAQAASRLNIDFSEKNFIETYRMGVFDRWFLFRDGYIQRFSSYPDRTEIRRVQSFLEHMEELNSREFEADIQERGHHLSCQV